MNLLDLSQTLLERTSRFTIHDWLMVFACIVLGSYAILLSRRR